MASLPAASLPSGGRWYYTDYEEEDDDDDDIEDDDNYDDDNTGFKDGMHQTVDQSPAFANAAEDNYGECKILASY